MMTAVSAPPDRARARSDEPWKPWQRLIDSIGLYYRTQLSAALHRARGELCDLDESSSWCRPMSVERAREQLELAEGRSHAAIHEHAQPPPDAGYARRLRAFADAAAQEQAAYRYADEQGFGWRPGPP